MSATRRYELVYIVTPDAPEEQVAAIHEQVEQTVQKMGGTLEKSENWGRRKLAYEIQHHKDGVYVLEVIVGGGELMKETRPQAEGRRPGHPPPRRPRGRGVQRGRTDADAPPGDAGASPDGAWSAAGADRRGTAPR